MRYAKKESCLFFSGIIFLLLGSVGDFVVPLYVGLVINALSDSRFDDLGVLCLQLFTIVSVSYFYPKIFCRYLVFLSVCVHILSASCLSASAETFVLISMRM